MPYYLCECKLLFVFDHNNDNFMRLNHGCLTLYCQLPSPLSGHCECFLIGQCETLPCLGGVPFQPIKIGINIAKNKLSLFRNAKQPLKQLPVSECRVRSTTHRDSQRLADIFVQTGSQGKCLNVKKNVPLSSYGATLPSIAKEVEKSFI